MHRRINFNSNRQRIFLHCKVWIGICMYSWQTGVNLMSNRGISKIMKSYKPHWVAYTITIIFLFLLFYRTIMIRVHIRFHRLQWRVKSSFARLEKLLEKYREFPSKFLMHQNSKMTFISILLIGQLKTYLP